MEAILIVFLVLVAGLAIFVGIRSSGGNQPLPVHGLTSSNSQPQIYYSFGKVSNPRFQTNSTNSAGSIIGTFTGSGIFEIIVRFSRPRKTDPLAVILSPILPANGLPNAGYVINVENVTKDGFEVIGLAPSAQIDSALFYYSVL